MTFDGKDFARIQVSLFVALALALAGAGLVWLADRDLRQATRQRSDAKARFNEFERKLNQVRSEETEIRDKATLYGRLRERGVIGDEQRLEWVELLRDIRENRRLLDLQYEFAPQQTMEKGADGNYDFKSSLMRMQLPLLHENDLLDLIGDLRGRAKAYIRVRSCKVARIPRGAGSEAGVATLNADCEIEWITIQPAKGNP